MFPTKGINLGNDGSDVFFVLPRKSTFLYIILMSSWTLIVILYDTHVLLIVLYHTRVLFDPDVCSISYSCPLRPGWLFYTLEQPTTTGGTPCLPGAPPPPPDRGKDRNLRLGKSDRAIFGMHTFGSQTPCPPPPPSSLVILACPYHRMLVCIAHFGDRFPAVANTQGCCQSLLETAFSCRFQEVHITIPPLLWDDMFPHQSETCKKKRKKCQFAPWWQIMALPEKYAHHVDFLVRGLLK